LVFVRLSEALFIESITLLPVFAVYMHQFDMELGKTDALGIFLIMANGFDKLFDSMF
jgi:hypothetical protein